MGIILFQVMRVEALAGIRPVVTRSEAIPVPVIGGAHKATCRSGRAPRGAWRSTSAATVRASVGAVWHGTGRPAAAATSAPTPPCVSYRAQPQTVDDDDQAMANAIAMTEAEPW